MAPTPEFSFARTRKLSDRIGDRLLLILTAAAAALAVGALLTMIWSVFGEAGAAFDRFGLGFVIDRGWDPVKDQFGAFELIIGTAITSLAALCIATPLAVAIALYLTELAPRAIRDVVGALVELLAAIPSVVLGLWGIIVLGPFIADHLGPALNSTLGFIPLFEGDPQGSGIMTAILVLTIMIVPIVASISREILTNVPAELKEGALALGATRWEMIRGVMLPAARPGIVAAATLGFGRALGEAIAVTQVIGGQIGIHWSLFAAGDTLASRIAAQYQGFATKLQGSSLVYLGVILLVISLAVNLLAQLLIRPPGAPKRKRFALIPIRAAQQPGGNQ